MHKEKIQEVLQMVRANTVNFKKKEVEFVEELKKSKNSLSLIEDFLFKVGSFTDSLKEGLEEIEGAVEAEEDNPSEEEIEEYKRRRGIEEEAENVLSQRLETASILEDLTNYIPDVLLRENLEIFTRILRDENEEIKNRFIFPQLKRSL